MPDIDIRSWYDIVLGSTIYFSYGWKDKEDFIDALTKIGVLGAGTDDVIHGHVVCTSSGYEIGDEKDSSARKATLLEV